MTYLTKGVFVLCFVLTVICLSSGQAKVTLGPEFQIYPTGAIPGVQLLYNMNEKEAFSFRLGYNVVRHGDAGEHSDERGGGFGLTVGYQHSFSGGQAGWFGELRSDIWFNGIDWQDYDGDLIIAEGKTEVTVLQPTIKAGYRIPVGQNDLQFIPSVAVGYEINLKTKGANVGHGAILLAGVALAIPIGRD